LTAFQGIQHHPCATQSQIPGEPFIQFGFSLSRPGICSNKRHHRSTSVLFGSMLPGDEERPLAVPRDFLHDTLEAKELHCPERNYQQ
jgi:hypothetical protein